MTYSLQNRLLKVLTLSVVACGLVATMAAFYFAYEEAQEFQDDSLRQIAVLDAGQTSSKSGRDRNVGEDQDSRIQLIHLPTDPRPKWLPDRVSPGFHTFSVSDGQERIRVFIRGRVGGEQVLAVQSTEVRNEIAQNSALRALIPLLILLPILTLLTATIVRKAFKPLKELSGLLDSQRADQANPVSDRNLPDEIVPFVQSINRLLERIERAMSGQRRFIADAAHELRTPLAALSLQAQNLLQADSPQQMRERLVPLLAGLDRTRRLTVQLLDLARLQASKPTLENVDVQEMVRGLMAEFLPLAETKKIDLGLENAGLTHLRSDPYALSMIIRNALDNAIKYSPESGEVTIRLIKKEYEARVEIIDSGPGIPSHDLDRVFDPFRRLSIIGEGSGLGLAIAHEAAEKLGGVVVLENRVDTHGLVFSYIQVADRPL